MNIYVVVEGEVTEIAVYRSWIAYLNPAMTEVSRLDKLSRDNFFLIAGKGYPGYFDRIQAAIDDINHYQNIDRLVIGIDSEELSYEEKLREIADFLVGRPCTAEIKIVIQHYCIESWALGNRVIVTRNPQNSRLQTYLTFYDVSQKNPEKMPSYPPEGTKRVHFTIRYLKLLLREKYKQLSYSKRNPKVLTHEKYFNQVRKRLDDTGHIKSFRNFIEAFT